MLPQWNDAPVIALRGELTVLTQPELARALHSAHHYDRVTLDLREVTYLDASSLTCFLELRRRMPSASEPRVRLIVSKQHVRMLRIVHFDSVFEIWESA